jgi:dipeptidyl aminopeptidase/acylaminoacyl peptidase
VSRITALFLAILISWASCPPLAAAEPQTIAEKSGYQSTSRYADVVDFCGELAKRSPLVRVETFGTSHEGRPLPLMVIADPPVASADEAAKSGKLVVLAFANIHAGEVDGKEALLALARDLTADKGHPLLKDLVILLVPILNADGNERIDPKNRPRENGPVNGAGIRANAQGFDLNRDFVKLESPEVRALVRLVTTWDPAVVVDCHTTNGSKHRFTLTYDGSRYPTSEVQAGLPGQMLTEATGRVKKETGFDIGPYGNFSADRTRWETYPASPRFGVQYFSLRGRLSFLSESYSYAPFRDRVRVSHAFVKALFETAVAHKDSITRLYSLFESRPQYIAVKTKTVAEPGRLRVPGFEEELKDGRRVATDRPKDYSLEYVNRVTHDKLVSLPFAYLIPLQYAAAADTLRRHGIPVEELREDIALPVEVYTVREYAAEPRAFQSHKLVTIAADMKRDERTIPAGTLLVRTTNKLGSLAGYLLEPESEDGLVTWNFFDAGLAVGKEYPVLRVAKRHVIATGEPRPLQENAQKVKKPITEALLLGGGGGRFGGGFAGTPPPRIDWLDGEHFLQVKENRLMKVHARTGMGESFVDADAFRKSLGALKELDKTAADRIARGTNFRMDPARTGALVDVGSDLAFAYFDGRPAVRLTKSGGGREFVTFSPDGKRIAFVRGGNLYAVEIADPGEKRLTTDGGGDVLNARGDWVYEEEIFNRNGRAYWWSPDGTRLAFLRFDDTPVKRFNLVNLNTPRGQLEAYPYPKAGDPNPTVKLGVASASGDKPRFLDLGEYNADDLVISRVGWMAESKGVFAYVQNRTQSWLDFVVWETPDAKPKKLFRETTKAWVEDLGQPHFLPDGSFLILSERTGYKHLYRVSADGKEFRPLTSNEIGAGGTVKDMEVRDVLRVDEKLNCVFFTATVGGSTRLGLCAVDLEGRKNLYDFYERDEKKSYQGTHQVTLAPSGLLYIDRYTDDETPTQTRLMEVGKGDFWPPERIGGNMVERNLFGVSADRVRTLDANPVRQRDEYKWGKYERVQVPMADGFVLEGAVTYPPDFDPAKKYPVWVLTYAGPHMPTVRTGWSGGRIFEQVLASSGIIAFRVDPRSASGKGAQSAWTAYKQLGVQELKDLEEAVAWLCKNPWADATRVGISGHSYGGFMAAYALTHSKTFSAGIASGAVTDWRLYDTIYTERYMLTPKENAEGYDRSSVVKAARNLSGKLLILHGMMDDNVHVQNSTQFADALQRAGKQFEMMFYPQSRHGLGGQHYQRLQLDFIRRTMGVNAPPK